MKLNWVNAGSLLQAAPVAEKGESRLVTGWSCLPWLQTRLLSDWAPRRDAASSASAPGTGQSLRKRPVGEPSLWTSECRLFSLYPTAAMAITYCFHILSLPRKGIFGISKDFIPQPLARAHLSPRTLPSRPPVLSCSSNPMESAELLVNTLSISSSPSHRRGFQLPYLPVQTWRVSS